jgi:hypothetical protein
LRSDTKKNLFEKLGEIADGIDRALETHDQERIGLLIHDHDRIMDALKNSSEPVEPGMKDAIVSAEGKIKSIIEKIQTMQSDIRRHLSTVNNKRLLKSAYKI